MLDPSRLREDLRVLAVSGGDHAPGKIEQEAARSGGPLVDRREKGHRREAISSLLAALRSPAKRGELWAPMLVSFSIRKRALFRIEMALGGVPSAVSRKEEQQP